MPRDNIKYHNTIIYKLVCKDVDITDCYVGHTTNFTKRKQAHKCNCNNSNLKQYSFYVYNFIRENGGWDNWSMIEIEKFDATDKNDALKLERYYIESLHATLNKNIPSRTIKQWFEENKPTIQEYKKEYYQENKPTIQEYNKEYYQDNKEKIKDKSMQYREENKEKIKQHKAEKIKCECVCAISRSNILKHKKTATHIQLMEHK